HWQAAVANSPLAARVRFVGHIANVADLLAAGDLLVSPVRYESYGLNVQEAICCGVPAIVSACAGVAERYPATLADLLLRDPEDAGELAARVLAWRADSEGWRHKLKPLTQMLRAYSWDDMAERIVTLTSEYRTANVPHVEHFHAAVRG
ncbi:MAG TPA: glycosyltransferase family 4 protein, partial [Steroidobacteraceae bacterium]|nr:glycosyltransferase family 4 protein [Steroidobacteraceae bacterium]